MERKSQLLTEAQQVGTLGVSDANPLPALAGAHQCRVHELQAAPLIEEARDDLGAPGESAGMETSGHGDTSGRITRIGNSRADACETPDGLYTSMYLFKLS